jgi:hypothetical protein
MMQLATGTTRQAICDEYRISERQLRRIITEFEDESMQWYQLLPKEMLVQLFRIGTERMFQKIQRLEQICELSKGQKEEFNYNERTIEAYSNYIKLIADGPALSRIKECLEEAEEYVKRLVPKR